MTRAVDDAGAVGGAEVLPLSILVLVVGSLLVANAWAVVDARLAADAAAQAAVRSYVEAPDGPTAHRRADDAARRALDGWGRDPTRAVIEVRHPDGRPWGRCVPVVVTVRYPVAVAALPALGVGRDVATVEARQSEVVDPYRAGLPGAASC